MGSLRERGGAAKSSVEWRASVAHRVYAIYDSKMIQEDIDSWEEFENRIRQLESERCQLVGAADALHVSPFLFRGQGNYSWSLRTTLERIGEGPWTFSKYFKLICKARPEIETFTGARWEMKELPELAQWAEEYDSIWTSFPAYDYLVYLRHHGFPSPLLDWTRSPFIAAFFAFSDAEPSSERVAIYAYMETTGEGKVSSFRDPLIRSFGPYVRSHSRHFLQQSRYTIAAQFKDKRWAFASHEGVFSNAIEAQDRLWKFTLPTEERSKVLKVLDKFNLNAFSLFQTEEALLRTITFRELELEKH